MIDTKSNLCDDALLYGYMDGQLDSEEDSRVSAHLESCEECRNQLAALSVFSKKFRERVRQTTDSVDFTALEKTVLNKALRERHSRKPFSNPFASLKYIIPATVTAGLLLFFGYSQYMSPPQTAPSAIINSFTGSMSSVMIFETPETRQTILWYKEDTDVESERNAV
jgi:anti-sigma factor RsiW